MSADGEDGIDVQLAGTVYRLVELTRAGKVNWEPVDGADGFAYGTPSATVHVLTRDRDQRDPYILEIRNPDGVVVERYFTGTVTSPVHTELSAGIAVLYTLARRRAMRLDLLLRTLSTDLDRL